MSQNNLPTRMKAPITSRKNPNAYLGIMNTYFFCSFSFFIMACFMRMRPSELVKVETVIAQREMMTPVDIYR